MVSIKLNEIDKGREINMRLFLDLTKIRFYGKVK